MQQGDPSRIVAFAEIEPEAWVGVVKVLSHALWIGVLGEHVEGEAAHGQASNRLDRLHDICGPLVLACPCLDVQHPTRNRVFRGLEARWISCERSVWPLPVKLRGAGD